MSHRAREVTGTWSRVGAVPTCPGLRASKVTWVPQRVVLQWEHAESPGLLAGTGSWPVPRSPLSRLGHPVDLHSWTIRGEPLSWMTQRRSISSCKVIKCELSQMMGSWLSSLSSYVLPQTVCLYVSRLATSDVACYSPPFSKCGFSSEFMQSCPHS